MSERLSDVSARIEGIHQLGSVVNAMRGIAGARMQKARAELKAVDAYSATIEQALGRALALLPPSSPDPAAGEGATALVVFAGEQGFAGAFSEKVLADIADETSPVFLVGTRGAVLAAERGIAPSWQRPLPAQSTGIPKLASDLVDALYERIALGAVDRVETIYAEASLSGELTIRRRQLLPLDPNAIPAAQEPVPPLLNLRPDALVAEITAEFLTARLTRAALHAFAAENQARMNAMAGARRDIDRRLGELEAVFRRVRQEAITAEIVELAAGSAAAAGGSPR
ncbi:F0F1 ATP synthase subunit gamma [Jiella avicenniae]|uniref:F0F1 ATP synthase subunit gamma n=1 Tax=Jiella avicenniae TaxID=2907202 RepID=A0A9X1P277_9HYPH|nr:F0F1 ATP synthase subunit gamma [Jiella avicenniae]MCE7027744.1 F0F1 ATP synthase subunit gamma [Jiella avicenniae]MCE7028786.1 F0F1 ATP synthase subunit gamma [Jiella avicenniae]